ncbi:hypothetical protein ACLOJK_020670 [Asimina triloba]
MVADLCQHRQRRQLPDLEEVGCGLNQSSGFAASAPEKKTGFTHGQQLGGADGFCRKVKVLIGADRRRRSRQLRRWTDEVCCFVAGSEEESSVGRQQWHMGFLSGSWRFQVLPDPARVVLAAERNGFFHGRQ